MGGLGHESPLLRGEKPAACLQGTGAGQSAVVRWHRRGLLVRVAEGTHLVLSCKGHADSEACPHRADLEDI